MATTLDGGTLWFDPGLGARMTVLMAFTVEHAAHVAGVSERRIRYWDTTGVLSPSLSHDTPRTPYGRIYSFRDLVGLRTLADLRDRFDVPLQTLRMVGARLRAQSETPWSELRFFVEGTHLYFQDPRSRVLISAIDPGQIKLPLHFDLTAVARETERRAAELGRRHTSDIGEIVTNRYVMGNRPVLAGTRIPTRAVWDFHAAGYDVDQIIDEYPRLTRVDVERAIAYEEQHRTVKRAS